MSATEEKAPVEPTAASQNPEASETTATTSTPAPEPIGEPTADVKPTAEAPAPAPAEIPAPAKTETSTSSEPSWPELKDDHPLSKLLAELPQITKDADYNEVYGIELGPAKPFHSKLILQKFLRANSNDLGKAKEQLLATLKWRKEFQPLKAKEESFEKGRFAGLGYVIKLSVPASTNKIDVATFNIYGAVKDNKAAFGDLDGFIRWRVGLMELGVEKLGLDKATQPIPNFGEGPDPYQGIQIHDYLNVSFLRMDPDAKAASKKTIETFQKYYPETLSRKFFVNVPVVMGWLFSAMKLFVAKETVKKFTVLSYGEQLANELGPEVPVVYGGKGDNLETVGETLKLE